MIVEYSDGVENKTITINIFGINAKRLKEMRQRLDTTNEGLLYLIWKDPNKLLGLGKPLTKKELEHLQSLRKKRFAFSQQFNIPDRFIIGAHYQLRALILKHSGLGAHLAQFSH